MGVYYVNSFTGNNANSGTSPSLAKRTLAAASTAANADGDTIRVTGIFHEALPVPSLNRQWEAYGYAELDGLGTIAYPTFTTNLSIRWAGFRFRRYVGGFVRPSGFSNCSWLFERCWFSEMQRAVVCGPYSLDVMRFVECQITDMSVAGFYASDGNCQPYPYFERCVFAGNPVSIWLPNLGNSPQLTVRGCISNDAVWMNLGLAQYLVAQTDYNVYNWTAGKAVVAGVDKETLAEWKAAFTAVNSNTNGAEANSIDSLLAELGDVGNRALRATPASSFLTAGPGGAPVGLREPAITISNTRNASLWTGGVFDGVEVDGAGYLALAPGYTLGTWASDVVDQGAGLPMRAIEVIAAGEDYPTTYLDADTADNPGQVTIEVRASNTLFGKGDASPAWIKVPRRSELGAYLTNSRRYWQVRLTLRG